MDMFGKRRPPEGGEDPAEANAEHPSGARPASLAGPARPESPAARYRANQPATRDPNRRPDYLVPGGRREGQGASEEGRRLVVGREISLSGEIKACDTLIVEGEVEANLKDCMVLQIGASGLYKGIAVVDQADVSGHFDGELTVQSRLILRASGRISGKLRYADLEIERGGKVSGTLEEIPPKVVPKPQASRQALAEAEAKRDKGEARPAPAKARQRSTV